MEFKEGRIRKGGLNPDPKISRPLPPKAQKNKKQTVIAEGEITNIETTKNTFKFVFNSGEFDYRNFPFNKPVKIILEEE